LSFQSAELIALRFPLCHQSNPRFVPHILVGVKRINPPTTIFLDPMASAKQLAKGERRIYMKRRSRSSAFLPPQFFIRETRRTRQGGCETNAVFTLSRPTCQRVFGANCLFFHQERITL
jgi:hypothetical protein